MPPFHTRSRLVARGSDALDRQTGFDGSSSPRGGVMPRTSRATVEAKLVDVKKINTLLNIADILTKLLAFRRFIELRDNGKPHPRMNRVD